MSALVLVYDQPSFDSVDNPEIRVLNPSRMVVRGRCPLEYQRRFVVDLGPRETSVAGDIALDWGTVLHEVVEHATTKGLTVAEAHVVIREALDGAVGRCVTDDDRAAVGIAERWLMEATPRILSATTHVQRDSEVLVNEQPVGFWDPDINTLFVCTPDQLLRRQTYVDAVDTKSVGPQRDLNNFASSWLRSFQAKVQGIVAWLWASAEDLSSARVSLAAYRKLMPPSAEEPDMPQTCACGWDDHDEWGSEAAMAMVSTHSRMSAERLEEHFHQEWAKARRHADRVEKWHRDRRDWSLKVFDTFSVPVNGNTVGLWRGEIHTMLDATILPWPNTSSCYGMRPCLFNSDCGEMFDLTRYGDRKYDYVDRLVATREWPTQREMEDDDATSE